MAVLQEFKCPCCEGAVIFDTGSQKMKCPYCDTEFDVEAIMKNIADQQKASGEHMDWDDPANGAWKDDEISGLRTYVCESCGGEIVCDANTAATQCPFCDNPVVMKGQVSGDLRPDLVIPFKLDKEAAKKTLKKHYAGKWLLPRAFKTENHIDEIKGIYVPFWIFSADVDADFTYDGTRYNVWSDGDTKYTETQHYSIVRGGYIHFDNVPVDGSSKMDDRLMESLEPFQMKDAVEFETAYLSGYLADRYDVNANSGMTRVNARIKDTTAELFANSVYGYAKVEEKTRSMNLKNSKCKYVLYPVWMLNTTWRGNKYTFAMNGQTGKMAGDLPKDKGLMLMWFFLILAAASALTFLLIWLLWQLYL